MKTRIASFALVALLALAGPVMAQAPGTADPLGPITVGAVVPFFGAAGNQAFLEISSPLGDNTATPPSRRIHIRFYTADCAATNSIDVPLSTNDVEIIDLTGGTGGLHPTPSIAAYNGLAVIASTTDGLTLQPLFNPIHARSHWINVSSDYRRIIEPITVVNFDASASQTWSPLVSGATFFAPLDDQSLQTTLVLICPSTAITGCQVSAGGCTGAADSIIATAPTLAVASARPLGASDTNGLLRGLVFDDDELVLRDIVMTCNCVTIKRVNEIDPVYTSVAHPNGTYTELRGGDPLLGDRTFTGYRAIRVLGTLTLDDWGRLSNGPSSIVGTNNPI
jgi:hypothetical protein